MFVDLHVCTECLHCVLCSNDSKITKEVNF